MNPRLAQQKSQTWAQAFHRGNFGSEQFSVWCNLFVKSNLPSQRNPPQILFERVLFEENYFCNSLPSHRNPPQSSRDGGNLAEAPYSRMTKNPMSLFSKNVLLLLSLSLLPFDLVSPPSTLSSPLPLRHAFWGALRVSGGSKVRNRVINHPNESKCTKFQKPKTKRSNKYLQQK